jgi:hypothetical protein
MNANLALRRLWWKEVRQLTPMVILLPTIALFLYLIEILGDGGARIYRPPSILLLVGMPGLFAVGAGALLVGHEKETRTIQWLRSLPIPASRIVRVKIAAALAGLGLLWLISGLLMATAHRVTRSGFAGEMTWTSASWILHSLFLLFAGITLAWRIRSALAALLWLAPVSLIPLVIAYLVDSIRLWDFRFGSDPADYTLIASQCFCIVVALLMADSSGRANLMPESAVGSNLAAYLPAKDRYRTDQELAGYHKIQSPMPALVWQFILQSRILLIGTSAMLAVAAIVVAVNDLARAGDAGIPLAMLLGFVASSWLGVSVFQGDSAQQRIRFLADRGISPRLVWLTRHAAPVGILAIFLGVLVFIAAVLTVSGRASNLSDAAGAVSIAASAIAVLYLASQWFSQVIASPIVSTIAAPFFSIATISYITFAVFSLGAPWWLLATLAPVPLIATYVMMRRWMDRRFGWTYWACHAAFLGVMIFVPAGPLLFAVATVPGMPSSVAKEMAEASRGSSYGLAPIELVLTSEVGMSGEMQGYSPDADGLPADGDSDDSTANAALLGDARLDDDARLDAIERQLEGKYPPIAASIAPVSASSVLVLDYLHNTLTLSRMRLQQDAAGASGGDDDPMTIQRYRRVIGLMGDIAGRMRLSPRVIEQDVADLLEITLLIEARRPEATEWFGEPLHGRTLAMLADGQGRAAARRRAVASSWTQFERENRGSRVPAMTFGGYPIETFGPDNAPTLVGIHTRRRQVGLAVAELWKLAKGGPAAATPETLGKIARLWRRGEGLYGLGIAGPYLRADDLDRFVHPGFRSGMRMGIGNQWFGGWERQAAHFKSGADQS